MKSHAYHKKCKWCGKEFDTLSARQMYCKNDYGECPVCGKKVKIKDYHAGSQCCSEKCRIERIGRTCLDRYGDSCAVNSEHSRKKARQTCQRKYGVDHYAQTDEFRKRFEQTCLERYGTTSPLKNEEIKKKLVETNLERYGSSTPLANAEVRKKIESTVLERYGGTGMAGTLKERIMSTYIERYGGFGFASEQIKQKAMQTCLERYGVVEPTKSKEVQEKTRLTNLERYGTESPLQNESIKKKIAQTNLELYGTENVFASEEIKERIRQSILSRYGVDCVAHIEGISERIRNTILERYGAGAYTQSDYGAFCMITDNSKIDEFLEFRKDIKRYLEEKFDSPPTLEQVAERTGVTISTVSRMVIEHQCQEFIKYRPLKMENDILDVVKSIVPNAKIILHSRKLIPPYEIDIYLPEYNFGIECNPTYTHNSSFSGYDEKKPIGYHKKKSDLANANNIFLLHIFGWEWTHRREQVISIIRNVLNKTERKIYARKTQIINVSSAMCHSFLEENHLQGSTNASIRLGLLFNEELVSVMTFNKVRGTIGSKKSDTSCSYELSRFCSKLNTNVVGGASKLFKYFIENYSFDNVISFSDVSHTRGSLYKILGFEVESVSSPCYCWVKLNTDEKINRLLTQKSRISKLFPNESIDIENLSESDIMSSHGYAKVYDCGKVRYVYQK